MFKEKRNTSKLIIHLQAEANHFDYEESRLDYFPYHSNKVYSNRFQKKNYSIIHF